MAVQSSNLRNRSALTITETELNVMAALAIIGLEQDPKPGIEHSRRDRHAQGIVEEREGEVLADVGHGCLAEPAGPGQSLAGRHRSRVMPALSIATSVPVPIAMPT